MDSARPSEVTARCRPLADAIAGEALDEMALGVAALLRPELDVIGALAALDELAGDCPTPTRDGVVRYLFESGMFQADRRDYHSWRNSCLDQVIVRRLGMPISLSVLAIEVARRVGVRLVGVGLPGHFVVGDADDDGWYADPFHARSGLTAADCRELVRRLGLQQWSDRFIQPVPERLIVARMLNNLKAVFESRHDGVRLALVMQARQLFPEFVTESDAAVRSLSVLN